MTAAASEPGALGDLQTFQRSAAGSETAAATSRQVTEAGLGASATAALLANAQGEVAADTQQIASSGTTDFLAQRRLKRVPLTCRGTILSPN